MRFKSPFTLVWNLEEEKKIECVNIYNTNGKKNNNQAQAAISHIMYKIVYRGRYKSK